MSAAEKLSGAHLQMVEAFLKTDDMLLSAKAASARGDRDATQVERLNLLIEVLVENRHRAQQAIQILSNATDSDPTRLERELRIVSEIAALSNSLVERFDKLKANNFHLDEPPQQLAKKQHAAVSHA